jgi:hypothetical protein
MNEDETVACSTLDESFLGLDLQSLESAGIFWYVI